MPYNGPSWRVSSARKRHPGYEPEPSTTIPRHDPNSYDRLGSARPEASYAPDWEMGAFPQWDQPTAPWWLLQFTLYAFAATALVRVFGIYTLHPLLVPLWALAAFIGAVTAFLGEHDAGLAVRRFALVTIAFTGVLLGSQARVDVVSTAIVSTVAAAAMALLVDMVGSHALEWRLRRLQVPTHVAARWLALLGPPIRRGHPAKSSG